MARLKIGDLVQVMRGKDRGKRGSIQRFVGERVIVEGIAMVTRHQKPTAGNAGSRIQKERPIQASNVMPIDPKTDKPTRVRAKVVDGKKVRVGKSGEPLRASA